MDKIYRDAHKLCSNNRSILRESKLCGCFYCLSLFNYDMVTDWIDDIDGTALCPFCSIDSVIPKSKKYDFPVDILQRMHEVWFWSNCGSKGLLTLIYLISWFVKTGWILRVVGSFGLYHGIISVTICGSETALTSAKISFDPNKKDAAIPITVPMTKIYS